MWSWCKPTCQHRMETCGTLGNSELASKYNVLIWVFVSLLHSFSTVVLAIFILKYRKHDLFWTQWKYAENSIWSETRVSKIETQAKYLIPLIWTAVKSQFSNGYPIVCAALLAKHARVACSLSQRFDNKSPEIITITMFLCCFFFSTRFLSWCCLLIGAGACTGNVTTETSRTTWCRCVYVSSAELCWKLWTIICSIGH